MPLPAAWTKVPITGRYLTSPDGDPVVGRIAFESDYLVYVDGKLIIPRTIFATVDSAGDIAVSLPSTNDPSISPVGWVYRVRELFQGGGGRPPFLMTVPHDAVSINMADVVPAADPGVVMVPGPAGPGVPTGGTTGQKLVKASGDDYDTEWADDTGGGASAWGDITGTLSAQTDLQAALDAKASTASLATKLDDLSAGTAGAIVTASADGTLLSRAAYTIVSLLAAARDRATHTGTQIASTISDFASAAIAAVTWSTITGKPSTFAPSTHASSHATAGGDAIAPSDIGAEVAGAAASAVSTHVGQADPHSQYALESSLGGAAVLNVGTTAGTVAAGDDSRITGAVPTSRTISAAGLATGGGSLAADRTITVTAASSGDVTTGTATNVAVTPGSLGAVTTAGKALMSAADAAAQLTALGAAAQLTATWEAGVGTTESVVSPAKIAAAIAALGGGGGSGDVVGPASATDNAIARYDTTTGKLLQNSGITVSDVSGSSVTLASTAGNALAVEATAPAATTGASQAGKALSLKASDAVASTDTAGAAAGADVTVEGGAAARLTSGNANGGNVRLKGAAGIGTGGEGQVLIDSDGTVTRPALAFDIGGNTGYGFWYSSANIRISINGVLGVSLGSGGVTLPANGGVAGDATTPGVLYGLRRIRFDIASTSTLTSGSYNGSTLTNSTAGAGITSTLVTAAAGWNHRFIDDNATHRWTIKPNTGDEILWPDGTVVSATGSVASTARYDAFDVEALDATTWLASNVRGTWTVTP